MNPPLGKGNDDDDDKKMKIICIKNVLRIADVQLIRNYYREGER